MVSDLFSVREPQLSPNDPSNKSAEEEFLRFHLVPDTTIMLPILQLTEVLKIPMGQIVPIPHMPSWVMGVYNWRGEILWMVDLGHLVGLTSKQAQVLTASTYNAVVIQDSSRTTDSSKSGKKMLGLVVNRVEDIEWCNPDFIKSPPASAVTRELAPFLRGYWLAPNGEMLLILHAGAIIAAMPKL